jgi:hypothetical protein
MTSWIIGGLAALFLVLCIRHFRTQNGVYRPLSSRQPERSNTKDVPLGMEAMDLKHIRSTVRQNESLERGNTSWTLRKGGFIPGAADTDVDPLSDDETYAARYHAAFHNTKSKD